MMQQLDDPIRVYMDCNGSRIRPLAFLLHGQKYSIAKLNLVFEEGSGMTRRILFSVCDTSGNTFTLLYNPFDLSWRLKELYTEG